MSNLREELSKLQAVFKGGPNTTRIDDSFANVKTVMSVLGSPMLTPTMRNVACAELAADAIAVACSYADKGFDLYEGIMRTAKERSVKLEDSQPGSVTLKIDGRKIAEQISKRPIESYPEVRESLRQIQRRDDVIEKTWQAIKSHATIHDVSWVPGYDGSTKRAEVRKPADKLPEAAAGVVKALESALELRDNVAADCRRRLEIAALSDRLIVSVDFLTGSVYVDGWRVATEGMAQHFERCLGLRMDHNAVEMHVNGIRDELRKLDSRLFAGVEYERDPVSARTIGATIKINTDVRDELAFRGMATSLERHKRESPDAVRSV